MCLFPIRRCRGTVGVELPPKETAMADNVLLMSLDELSGHYQKGTLSPVEVARAHLAHLAKWEPKLNAFQIVDDLLDYVGDTALLGKRAGQDQRTGRVTFPLLLLRDAEPSALAAPPDALVAALHHHGVPQRCLAAARAHHDRALAALVGLPGDVSELQSLATRCVERQA
jgi:hypothetical protein